VKLAAWRDRNHLVLNQRVGCYAYHYDVKISMYSSGLATSFGYVRPQDFPLLFVIIFSSLPLQKIMAPRTPLQVEHGIESSRTTGASCNTPPAETQLERCHIIAHCDAVNSDTENVTVNALFQIVPSNASSRNKKHYTIGSGYTRIEVDNRQLMIYLAPSVPRELGAQFLATGMGHFHG